ncbi:uncharacterized protein LOC114310576 [Camellia sinensis]|uniref:uncharacterized protein LOC114310576 n=1 Tax=Camellia sinensis TaxID=4442 RepID=UPI0010357590|nr:uncharacterized protein LOC114310576 [Camellia sinensis]
MGNLRGVQDNLKVWKREVFGDLNEVKAELVQEIEKLDAKEFGEGLSRALRDKRSLLRMKVVLGKRKKNFIKNLEVRQGVVVSKEEFVVKEIFNFYSNLYSDGGVDRPGIEGINWAPVESMTANWLERPFDEYCWDIVKGDHMRVFGEFFESGEVNLCAKASFICLIPKKEKSVQIGDFRPISLVTPLYKILATVLSKRIRVFLGETMSSAQGAFVQGRQILNVVLVANEVVEEYRGLHKEDAVFKVTLRKRMTMLIEALWICFGKERVWIYVENVDLGVLVILQYVGHFADVLSWIIDIPKDKGVIEGFMVGRDRIGVTHLQFADDTIFFSSNEESKMGSLLKILRIFEIVSGLKVNLSKSSVVGINLGESYVRRVADMLGCSIELFPLKYLAIGGDPRVASFWEPVLVKIEKRLEE